MSFTVEVLDPRTDPEPPDWEAFRLAEVLPVPWDYGLLGVESRTSPSPNLLTVVRDDGILVAAVSAMLCRPHGGERPGPVGGAARLGPRWLEVQNAWLSGYPAWAFAEHLDERAREEVLRVFERAICRYAGIGCLGVVYRVVPPELTGLVSGRGRVVREVVPTMVLRNDFGSYEDWLASLSRSRRFNLRGIAKKVAADPDIEVRVASGRTDVAGAELATLLRSHRSRHGKVKFDNRGVVTAEYLDLLVRREDVYTTTYHDGTGRLIAFTDLLDHPDTPLSQHWAARDFEDGRPKHLYFDFLTRAVRQMIDGNRKALSVGRGLSEVKSTLGFEARPLRAVIVPRPVAG
jgi:uncharacterized protein